MTKMSDDLIEQAARYAYEDAYPGKPWGMADTFTASMFKQQAAYYAPAFGRLIEALIAERDAAVAFNGSCGELDKIAARSKGFAEGERRATAAIVADLKLRADQAVSDAHADAFRALATRYERREHLAATMTKGE